MKRHPGDGGINSPARESSDQKEQERETTIHNIAFLSRRSPEAQPSLKTSIDSYPEKDEITKGEVNITSAN